MNNRAVLTDSAIKDIHKEAQSIKDDSYLTEKGRMDKTSEGVTESDLQLAEAFPESKLAESVNKKISSGTAKQDQMQTDLRIAAYKKSLPTRAEKELFEYFLLGSYNRASEKTVTDPKSYEPTTGRPNKLIKSRSGAAKTSMSRLGFNSSAISDRSVDKFLRKYIDLTSEVYETPPELLKEIKDTAVNLSERKVKYEEFPEQEVDFIETPFKDTKNMKFVGDMEYYEGLVKGELPKDEVKIITELAENLHYYHKKESMNLNQVSQWLLEKPLNEMTKNDYTIMNNFFKDLRSGDSLQKFFKEDSPDLQKRFYLQFPKSVNKAMMKYDVIWLKQQGFFTVKGEKVFGTVKRPSWWIEGIQEWIGRMGEKTMELGDKLTSKLNWDLSFYVDNIPNGELLRQVAIRKMEKGIEDTDWGRMQKSLHYKKNYDKLMGEKVTKDALKKEYSVLNPLGQREVMTGEQIVDTIRKTYIKTNKEMSDFITGDPNMLEQYRTLDKDGKPEYYDVDKLEPKYNWREFVKDMADRYKRGAEIPTTFGLQGLRHIARSMMFEHRQQVIKDLEKRRDVLSKKKSENLSDEENKELYKIVTSDIPRNERWLEKLKKMEINDFEPMNTSHYYPHIFSNRKTSLRYMEKEIEEIERMNLPKEDKKVLLKKLIYKMNTLEGDWADTKDDIWQQYDREAQEILEGSKEKGDRIRWWDSNQKTGNMFSRESHLPDYSIDHSSYEIYQRNLARTYFNQMNQIFTRGMIDTFSKRAKELGWDKIKFDDGGKFNLLQKWENYLKLYAQDAMGNPSVIPDFILKDPGMKISGTPYAWWADNKVKDRMQKIKDMLISDKTKYPNINKLIDEIPYSTLNKISNLEAKFELASLLAHPKSAVANIFGGTMHTLQSAGYQNWKKGRDIKWLQRINPDWKSIEDINKFIIKHNVVPDFMIHEWGLSPEVRRHGKQEFMKDVVKNMKNNKIDRKTFAELMDKHKLSKSMMDFASSFMSKPEMMLRRQSFMAHYVQAWERFDGAIENIDHPFLIEAAKKGVQATQFLYSAPYRPAFARTALGKIMTRFQLWQWNAVRFRNDIAREARIFGLQEGSPAFEKFRRTLQLDMLVFALSNVFAYSLFDATLPAPWNWYQDTAQWLFGDEKERERTFMGTWPAKVAPLQMVTPPIFRLPVAGLDSFLAKDWERFSNYHIYTMFPFGRIIKDVSPYAKNNLIENPMGVIDKFTGFPMYGLKKQFNKIGADDES
tara:strand:- start:427 stop:4134 length:3708 start_codon:yes stop_codon:yes gene_type:complete